MSEEQAKKPDELSTMRSVRTLIEKHPPDEADRILAWAIGFNGQRTGRDLPHLAPLGSESDARQGEMPFGGT